MTPPLLLALVAGGALGAVARYTTSVLFARRSSLPWAVAAVNVLGSAIAGVALGLPLDAAVQLVVVSGFCGGLTTFSTFGVETVQLLVEGRRRVAALNVTANLVLSVAAVAGGLLLARVLG